MAVLVYVPAAEYVFVHMNVHVSPGSSRLLELASPLTYVTGEHLSSVTKTFDSGSVPSFFSLYVYVTGSPRCTLWAEAVFVRIVLGLHTFNVPTAKSNSVAVSDWDERVFATNLAKHPSSCAA